MARRVYVAPNLRGKTQSRNLPRSHARQLRPWGLEAPRPSGRRSCSDRILKPVAVYPDAARTDGALVMCEVMLPNGRAASVEQARHHPRRSRRLVASTGIFLLQGRPFVQLSGERLSGAAGPYYTGVGYKNVGDIAEDGEKHLDLCVAAGINHEGINAELAKGQWEFQVFGKGSKTAADQMWMAAIRCFV